MILIIARTEFKRLFNSPLAWIVLALLQFILAWVFLLSLDKYLTEIQPALAGSDNAPGLTDIVIASLYLWSGVIMLGVMPILTMRLIA